MQIEILDHAMSAGKSLGLINWMLENPQNKYLYVSPMLSEVEERIPEDCESLDFISPNTNEHKTKSKHLLDLLKNGENISFTHNLFTDLTKEHLYWINLHKYTLIIDEEVSFIEAYRKYSVGDIISLEKEGFIEIDTGDLGRMIWKWNTMEENTKYSALKRMCDLGMVYCSKRDRNMMVIHLPVELITSADRVIVSTYLFDGSIMDCFVKMKGIKTFPFKDIQVDRSTEEVKKLAQERITFINDTRTSKKVRKWSLAHKWWEERATEQQIKDVDRAIVSLCRASKDSAENIMWTVPKGSTMAGDWPKKRTIRTGGYSYKSCYIACSCRATNDLDHKTTLIHAYNRFPPQTIRAYLEDYGFPIDIDQYALSELIQWVWRSAIRKREHGNIQLAILSDRMLNLFKGWLYE